MIEVQSRFKTPEFFSFLCGKLTMPILWNPESGYPVDSHWILSTGLDSIRAGSESSQAQSVREHSVGVTPIFSLKFKH